MLVLLSLASCGSQCSTPSEAGFCSNYAGEFDYPFPDPGTDNTFMSNATRDDHPDSNASVDSDPQDEED